MTAGRSIENQLRFDPAFAAVPDWAGRMFEVFAVAPPGKGSLATARVGERMALDRLRSDVQALPLEGQMTVKTACKPESLDRALLRARVTKVEYLPDGSVRTRVTLDGGELWDVLRTTSTR